MNRYTMRWSSLVALSGALVLAGCSSSKTKTVESEKTEQSTEVTPTPAAPSGTVEQGESAVVITPAATVEGIWTQIETEQGRLSTTIQNGQLKDVHPLAFGIRDLVVALADKSNAATPANATRLNGMVDLVKASASRLDELGDAGDLSGTQAEYAKLDAVLAAIKSVVGMK
ncbi:MAG: hypothetical protein ABIU54_14925 [Candidatus Eisenbacteria bacterium]